MTLSTIKNLKAMRMEKTKGKITLIMPRRYGEATMLRLIRQSRNQLRKQILSELEELKLK